MTFLALLLSTLRTALSGHAALLAENLALRHQLEVLQRKVHARPPLTTADRTLWVVLRHFWSGWKQWLTLVRPETVVAWHRAGFRRYWRRKSRPGRPKISPELRALIRKMSRANPTWGAPRLHGELLKLGFEVSETTVAKYKVTPDRTRPGSGQGWTTFLANHLPDLVAVDFIIVPTATFRVLYAWVILSADRRRVVHFGVTSNPTSKWLVGQLNKAFPTGAAPGVMLRDRDGAYGKAFQKRLAQLGIRDLRTAPRSPWQNGMCERLMGSIRRELLDHVVVFNERHLTRLLTSYFAYYNESRTHLSLAKDAPIERAVMAPEDGDQIVAIPQVGGLHHRYERRRRKAA